MLKDWSRILFFCAMTLNIAACSWDNKDQNKNTKPQFGAHAFSLGPSLADYFDFDSARTFTVSGPDGKPLANANILIGTDDGNPFAGNRITTDSQGRFVAPTGWTTALPVTIEATGFVRTTFTDMNPVGQPLHVQANDGTQNIQISGTTTDFGDMPNNNKIHFALVLPKFTRQSLVQFDMSSILSPETDDLTVMGKTLKLPSNLTLPHQDATYIFPITLDKSNYRTYVREPNVYHYAATHGQFPLNTVVNGIRSGKSIFQLVNNFEFLSAGSADIPVGANGATQDFSVNQVTFDSSFSVQAPTLADGQLVVALAMNEDHGLMYPTDLKRIDSGSSQTLKTSSDSLNKFVLSMMKVEDPDNSTDFKQLSFSFQEANSTTTPEFLDLIIPPTVNNNQITLTPPSTVQDITPIGTYLDLCEVEVLGSGQIKTERRTRLWEFYAPTWVSTVTLPNVNIVKDSQKSYRWEVMYFGRQGAANGANLFDNITHITRNVLDL